MLRKIKFKEFKDLYRKHIIKDFPKNERASLESFRKRMLKYKEETYIFEDDGVDKGYCLIDKLDFDYILVAYLAVYGENRGKGIGTKILEELKEKYGDKKGILLEVENPEFAKDKEERNVQQKRINFYERAGFNIIDNINVELYMVNYKIMLYNNKNYKVDVKEIENALKSFYYTRIDKKRYKYIKIKTVFGDGAKKQS